jgi:hypothetical protein
MHYILSVQSDPMIVTFVLAGVDQYLSGRPRWAFWLGVMAALGRPEAWCMLAPYSLYVWLRIPSMRRMVAAGWLLILFFWFGIPTITNHRPFVSAQLAERSPRKLTNGVILGTLGRFTELQYLPMWIAALITVAWAAIRRNWLALWLAGAAVLWVIVEIAFAYHGWPALGRYMFEPAAVAAVLAGAAIGLLLNELPRLRRELPRWIGIPVVAVLIGALVPGAIARMRAEHRDLRHERARTHQIALLQTTTNALGGARHIQNCGQPVTDVTYVSALAWLYHRNVGSVGGLQQHVEAAELANPALPKVLFKPLSGGGWAVRPWHTRPSQLARCRGLAADYAGGVLIHR